MQVHPQATDIFRWLGEQQSTFTLHEQQQRFPAFPPDQHVAIARTCVKARLLRLLWFPDAAVPTADRSI
jgi:hypothetical protein